MKNYELDINKKGQFILNYELKREKIKVNYANGDSVLIDFTEKNIEILDKHMRNQVENSNKALERFKHNFKISF